jgi:two-component system chemotaxis response regulator CheY
MDITMPEKMDFRREIVAKDPDARVIFISALGHESMVKQAILTGARDFIVKPFQPDRVVSALKKAIG